jgi:hypothetical protein
MYLRRVPIQHYILLEHMEFYWQELWQTSILYKYNSLSIRFTYLLRFGRKFSTYLLITLNALFNVLTAILLNIDKNQTTEIAYGILRLLSGISANVYVVAVVIGKH